MNRQTFGIIVTVLLVLIVTTVGYMIVQQNNVQGVVNETPTPTVTPPTPTPTASQVVGTIEEIGEQVDYKNSTLLRVNGTVVYLTEATEVVDTDNAMVDPTTLTAKQAIIVEGLPVEGGFEATKITVVSKVETPTPSRKPTATPTMPAVSPS